jgi:hypothetical protein
MADMSYDGKILKWGSKTYAASSGMAKWPDPILGPDTDYRFAKYQDSKGGPVPEGNYILHVFLNGTAGLTKLGLDAEVAATEKGGIQNIPKVKFEGREYSFPDWGTRRIRIHKGPGNTTKRNNFYLHDSAKGYSHGCIEVVGKFFDDLRNDLVNMRSGKRYDLTLNVKYASPESSTNGGTKK